jgi:hypothetical protein
LSSLYLGGNCVTDAGILELAHFKLRWLSLDCTDVSRQGVEILAKALPDCLIAGK